jgi:putative transposase
LKLQRTVHAKLVLDRKNKCKAIEREYNAWQRELQGRNEQLYSATKQQAERFKQRVRKQNDQGLKVREYPMILRRDCVKLQEQEHSMFHWWIRIPAYPKSIWMPIQLPYEQEPLLKHELRECKLIRDGEEWFVNVTIQKEARLNVPV